MVERELPKLVMRVRFPLPAPINKMHPCGAFLFIESRNKGIEPERAGGKKLVRWTNF